MPVRSQPGRRRIQGGRRARTQATSARGRPRTSRARELAVVGSALRRPTPCSDREIGVSMESSRTGRGRPRPGSRPPVDVGATSVSSAARRCESSSRFMSMPQSVAGLQTRRASAARNCAPSRPSVTGDRPERQRDHLLGTTLPSTTRARGHAPAPTIATCGGWMIGTPRHRVLAEAGEDDGRRRELARAQPPARARARDPGTPTSAPAAACPPCRDRGCDEPAAQRDRDADVHAGLSS